MTPGDNAAIWYGGDYNPEQWPEEIWHEDARLMGEAKVNLVSLGIFSWAKIEPREGEFDFGWLDRVMDTLHAAGVRVDLATATASPPPWLTHRYPEVLPVTEAGVRLAIGSRQQYCPSSPVYRRLAARLTSAIADRYSGHPALEMWHINNEYGCHLSRCYCDVSARSFRDWLQRKYGSVDELNSAWGTAFWSQQYSEFAEVQPPRQAPYSHNPAQLLDFDRFSSDELLDLYRAEAAIVRAATPNVPVTTNFMGFFKPVDYWSWAAEVDVISDDCYPDPVDPESPARAAMAHDLMRSLRGGQPWLLMEQATSAVNWRPRNAAKQPGQMAAGSAQAIARGADGILFFQWRQSVSGAEKFHSGMVPHAGTNSRVWREVSELGTALETLVDVAGSTVPATVAIVFEWDSWWSIEQPDLPGNLNYVDGVFAWYQGLFDRNVIVDFVRGGQDLSRYDVVIVPTLFAASTATLSNLAQYGASGGTLVVTYQTGITDERARITADGYLGALQETLGIRVEEFAPLAQPHRPGASDAAAPTIALEGSLNGSGSLSGSGSLWSEYVHCTDAEVESTFASGPLSGWPAITRSGRSWYAATLPDGSLIGALLERVLTSSHVRFDPADRSVERVVRGEWEFEIDHTTHNVRVSHGGVQRSLPDHESTGESQLGSVHA
jgi:beta-galactosidase